MSNTLPPRGEEDEDAFPEPPRLRALRRLVSALTAVLTLGMIVIAGSIAWRVFTPPRVPDAPPVPVTAEALNLPEGRAPTALGASASELLVWTRDDSGAERLMIFRRADGALISDTPVVRTP